MLKHCFRNLARTLARGNYAGLDGQRTIESSHSHDVGATRPRLSTAFWPVLAVAGLLLAGSPGLSQPPSLSRDFNRPGNILIADQFNNRVIEINPAGNILWSFGRGPNDFSPKGIIGVNDAQRV